MVNNINDVTEKDIKNIVDSTIRTRGKEYYEEGRVRSLEIDGERINAEVQGTSMYDVEIRIESGELQGFCSCPYDGEICKHIVAVLYQWIYRNDKKSNQKDIQIAKAPAFEEYLDKLSKEELISLLSDLSRTHKEVKQDLSLRMATSSKEQSGEFLDTILNHFKRELRNNDLDYYQLPYAIRSLERIKKSIEHMFPAIRQRLLDSFIQEAIKAYEEGADDSDGRLGEFISECINDLGKAILEQHLSFEKKKELFVKYLKAMNESEYGSEDDFSELLLTIAEQPADYNFLITEIKKFIESAKDKYDRDGLKEFIIEIYQKSGRESEYLIEIENKLEWSEDYLRLAEFWEEKGDVEKAMKIAQIGIDKRKNSWGNDELFRFLEELYRKKGKEKELLRTYVSHFSEASSLPFYRKIKTLALKLEQWGNIQPRLIKDASNHVYIDILLDEGEEEKAIKEALKNDELPDKSLEKVVHFVKKGRPREAIRIFDALVQKYIRYSVRGAYAVAAQHTKNIKGIYLEILKDAAGWQKYIGTIRKEHAKKPALLDEFRRL